MSPKLFLSIMLLFIACSFTYSTVVFASSDNWIEVAILTGGGGISTTQSFSCDHVDWRIRWEIEPNNSSERTAFLVYIKQTTGTNASSSWFESIQHYGTETTSGVLYIYDRNGSFIMDVLASIESYTMIIEQNLDSIAEFPSWAPLLIVLVVVMVVAIIYRRRIRKHNHGAE